MRKLQTQSGSYHQSVFSLSQGSNTVYYAKSAAPPIASTKQVTAEMTARTASLSDNSFSELSSCSENINYASLPQNTNTLQHHASLPADSMKTWHNRHYQATGIENGAREYSPVSPTLTFDFTNFIQCQIPTASKTPDSSTNIDKVEEKRANGVRVMQLFFSFQLLTSLILYSSECQQPLNTRWEYKAEQIEERREQDVWLCFSDNSVLSSLVLQWAILSVF